MSLIKICLAIAIVASNVFEQTEARPKAENMRNYIMKTDNEVEKEIVGNETGQRLREPKNIRRKNSDLIKSFPEYEYDEEYDAPIIEIKFKRDTTTTEDVDDAFNKLRRDVLKEKELLRNFMRWSKSN